MSTKTETNAITMTNNNEPGKGVDIKTPLILLLCLCLNVPPSSGHIETGPRPYPTDLCHFGVKIISVLKGLWPVRRFKTK